MEFLTLQDVPRYHHRSAMTFRERSPPLHLAKQHEATERMKVGNVVNKPNDHSLFLPSRSLPTPWAPTGPPKGGSLRTPSPLPAPPEAISFQKPLSSSGDDWDSPTSTHQSILDSCDERRKVSHDGLFALVQAGEQRRREDSQHTMETNTLGDFDSPTREGWLNRSSLESCPSFPIAREFQQTQPPKPERLTGTEEFPQTNPSLPPFSELLKFSKSSPDSQSAHIKSPPAAVDHWQAPSARTSRQSSAERPVFNDPFRGAPPPNLASHSSTHHPRPTENYTMHAEGRPSLLQARPSANYESRRTSLRADYEPRIPSESRHSLPSPFNPRVSPPAAVTQVYHPPPAYAAAIPIPEAHRYTESPYGPIAYHNEYHTPRAPYVSERVPVRHDSTVFTGSGHHWPPPPPHYAYPPGYGYVIDHNVPENYPGGRRRRGNLPKEATALLKKWFQDHAESPYPSDEEKTSLATSTGLSQAQISNWFINARRRNPGKEAREMTRAMNNNRSSGQQQAQGTNGSQEQDLSVQPSASSSPQQTRPSQQHREQHYVLPQIAAPQPYHYDPRDHTQDRDHEMGNT